ncbi:MAG: alpha-L-fucosidase, partial [Clostridium sp.]|nr:alpha-L-fucosidase [Clostridium sp.]
MEEHKLQAEQMENRLDILKQHLKKIDEVIENGPYKAHWDSLAFHKVPDWYKNAKFGIFIHWGVFSVPAYGSEWYPRWMYKEGTDEYRHHTSTYGPLEQFGYKDFIPMF